MIGSTSKRSLPTCTGFYETEIKIQIQIQILKIILTSDIFIIFHILSYYSKVNLN